MLFIVSMYVSKVTEHNFPSFALSQQTTDYLRKINSIVFIHWDFIFNSCLFQKGTQIMVSVTQDRCFFSSSVVIVFINSLPDYSFTYIVSYYIKSTHLFLKGKLHKICISVSKLYGFFLYIVLLIWAFVSSLVL